jgi:Fic family protein
MPYNWQQEDWPHFSYDLSTIHPTLFTIAEKMGFSNGALGALPENIQIEAIINFMVEEAIKSSEIEGENINRQSLRSSIKHNLGITTNTTKPQDFKAQGLADLMLDVRDTFKEPLSETKLLEWHLMLSSSLNPTLRIAQWRSHPEPMQVVSGHYGKWVVHFEAPPSERVPQEMKAFIRWFNKTAPGKPAAIAFPPVRAAIAHLYFESIHPFEDGNGRIGRAIAEKALSQGFGHPVLLSLSHAIENSKKNYYAALKQASSSNEITMWVQYFCNTILEAQNYAAIQIDFVLKKSNFFNKFSEFLNKRQLKVIKRMLKAGPNGFEGGMSAKKYSAIADVSKATATRDLQYLLEIKALIQTGGGRSIRYDLNL